MVGQNPTTRDPSLEFSPPKFGIFSSPLEPHDFDPIEEWLLDPDHLLLMDSLVMDTSSDASDLKTAEKGFSNPDGFDLGRVEQDAEKSEIKEESFGVVFLNPDGIAGGGSKSAERTGLLDLGLSEELLGKVSLVGDSTLGVITACDAVPVKSSLSDGSERCGFDGISQVLLFKEYADGVTGDGVPEDGNGDGKVRDVPDVCIKVVNSKENGVAENDVLMTTPVEVLDKLIADENNSESNETESDSTTSESDNYSSSSSSSSEEDNEGDEVDADGGGTNEKEMDKAVEVEEGEIMDLNQEEMAFISDDEEERISIGPIKSKNELEALPPVPPVDVALEPHHQTLPVGVISSIVGARVIVEGLERHNPLNEGSVLWITDTRSPLGLVDEIFGPVKNPYYIVRYNTDKEVPVGISEGTAISFVMDFAHHIINEQVLCKKGYDASGENDEEVSEELEFSDDEKEAEYRRSLRQSKRGKGKHSQGKQREAFSKKRVQLSSAGENVQPLGPRAPAVPAQLQSPAVGVNLSGGNCTCFGARHACGAGPFPVPAIPQAVHQSDHLGIAHQNLLLQQPNAAWFHGMPTQQQNANVACGFPMMPTQQLHNNQQHQQQLFPGFSNDLLFQQQFGPNQGVPPNVPWLGGPVNNSVGSLLSGPMGLNYFNQAPCMGPGVGLPGLSGLYNQQGYGQLPPAVGQSDLRPSMQFSYGTPPVRGRNPRQRGGRYPFGRSGPPRNG